MKAEFCLLQAFYFLSKTQTKTKQSTKPLNLSYKNEAELCL